MSLRLPSRRLAFAAVLAAVASATQVVAASPALAATTLSVSTTADTGAAAGACGDATITTVPSPLSLREATCLADNIGGAVTITVPAGRYTLSSGELQLGRRGGGDVTVTGAGAAATVIDGGGSSRILNLDPSTLGGVTTTLSRLTLTRGRDATGTGGAAVLAGSVDAAPVDRLTLDGVVVSSSTSVGASAPGGGVQMFGGDLTVTGATFDQNSSDTSGSAIYYEATGSGQALSVSGTSFTGNAVSGSAGGGVVGGALAIAGQAGSATVSNSSFTSNTASSSSTQAAAGAALLATSGTVSVRESAFITNAVTGAGATGAAVYSSAATTMRFNRIVRNAGGGAAVSQASGSLDAQLNWWGCNGLPGSTGCDATSGSVLAAPVLSFSASASPVRVTGPGASSTLTGSLRTDSSGAAVAASDLDAFGAAPVTFSDPAGDASVDAAVVTPSAGVATTTYRSGTVSGPSTSTVTLDNASVPVTVTVDVAPAVTTSPADRSVLPGQSVTFTAAATGSPTPTVQWQRSTDGGATFSTIAGATATSYTFTATAGDNGNRYRAVFTNSVGTATTTAAALEVGAAPAFTSADSTRFQVGVAGSFTVTTTGTPTATITRAGAAFPAWLSLTDNGDGTATLAGTPPAGSAGAYTSTLQAANGISPSASQPFTLAVDASPVFTSGDRATFTVGVAGSFTVTTTAGYPTATSITRSGTLPSGVTFTDNGDGTATIAGTPVSGTGGAYGLNVRAQNGGSAPAATQSLAISVREATTFTSADRATFSAGATGGFTVRTTGVPTATSITATGTLPTGVTLTDNGDGTATLAGTPAAGSGGVYPLTLSATNRVGAAATQSFTLTVRQGPALTAPAQTTFTVGTAGSQAISASGQPTPAITVTGTLPTGVTFVDGGDGAASLAGTPAAGSGGTYALTVAAANGSGPAATQPLTLVVREAPAITSASSRTFTVGTAGSVTVTTSGTPAVSAITSSGRLPSGVAFTDNGDGTATIAGTPAALTGGTYPLTLTATNGVGTAASQSFTLRVEEAPALTAPASSPFSVGVAGTQAITASGFPAPAITVSGTLPAGVSFRDNGDGTATLSGTPAAGTAADYPLSLRAANGVGSASTATLVVQVRTRAQSITVTSQVPSPAVVGASYTPAATAGSGLPVEIAVGGATTASACAIRDGAVVLQHVGRCRISYTQGGDATWAAAEPVYDAFDVTAVTTTTTVGTSPAATVFGQTARLRAVVTAGTAAQAAGTVQFLVDGSPVGSPVAVDASGAADGGALRDSSGAVLQPGAHALSARFTPTDATTYAASTGDTTHVVSQAATETTVDVRPVQLRATVVPVAPGAGRPGGQVAFSVDGAAVGTAPVVDGVATLAYVVSTTSAQQVSAVYSGDTRFTGSSGSDASTAAAPALVRRPPSITAKVMSSSGPTRFGWYRTPVQVSFSCGAPGAPLVAPCPAPVALRDNGAAQSVTRTVTTTDGGVATAVVTGVNVDRRAPKVRVRGVRDGATYVGDAPKPRCKARDGLSGVAKCRVVLRTTGAVTTYRVVAVDRAGNRRVVRGWFRIERRPLAGGAS